MEKSPTYYHELITKYLSGEVSVVEMQDLSDWIASSVENREIFTNLRKTWILAEQAKAGSSLDVDAEWDDLKKRITANRVMEVDSGQSAVGGMQSKQRYHDDNSPGDPYSLKRTTFRLNLVMRIAAAFLLIAVPSFFIYRYFSSPEKKIILAVDQMMDARLPDGSTVTLNKGSSLEFTGNFRHTEREVVLKGEAFFSVKHDTESKFIIVNGNVRIEDIGTSFYVNAQKADGRTEVILTEGKVSVYFMDNPGEQVVMNPGERVDVSPSENSILKSVNRDENYMAWKTRKLVFNDSSMDEVAGLLNEVYHCDIRLSGKNIHNCRLSATFDKQSLESVLHVIRSTLDVSIISRGTYIEISAITCE